LNYGTKSRFAVLANPLTVALLCASAFAVALYPVSDADIFWHLRTGSDILSSRALPVVDTYSVSSLGEPWTDGHVLFQLGVATLYKTYGLGAIVLAKAILVALAAAVLGVLLVSRTASPWLSAVWAMVLIALSRPLLLERPVVLSLLFVVTSLALLEQYLLLKRWQWLIALPPICGLWTWCQPLWPLGLCLVLAYLAGQVLAPNKRGAASLGIALAACVLFCLAGPYGASGLKLPFVHLLRIGEVDSSVFSANISENLPLRELLRTGDSTLVAAPIVAALAFGLLLARPRCIPWPRLLVIAAFFGLTLMANRNALLFYWTAALLCGLQLSELASAGALGSSRLLRALPIVAFAAEVAWLAPEGATLAELKEPRPFLAPQTSMPLLEKLPHGAKVFTSVRYGSFLVLRTAPRARPYIDGRVVLRSKEQFEEYLRAVDDPETFPALDERFHFDAVLLPVAGPQRYQRLIASLAAHPAWTLVHTDGIEVLFERSDTATPALALADTEVVARRKTELEKRFAGKVDARDEALTRLGWLLSLLENEAQAAAVLGKIDTPKAQGLLGASHYRAGDLGAARRVALRLLEREVEDVNALVLLAAIALDENKIDAAKAFVRRAADRAPHDKRVESLARRTADLARGVPPT
jgi:hypothetical protein